MEEFVSYGVIDGGFVYVHYVFLLGESEDLTLYEIMIVVCLVSNGGTSAKRYDFVFDNVDHNKLL